MTTPSLESSRVTPYHGFLLALLAYLSMANVLLAMKKDREAEEFYARARAHGMPGYLVPFAKARIYYLQGDTAQAARYLSEVQKMRGSPDIKEGTEAPKMPR